MIGTRARIAAACGLGAIGLAVLAAVWIASGLGSRVSAARGEQLFAQQFTPADGLGPLYNNTSCLACHNTPSAGGAGPNGLGTALRVGHLGEGGFDPLVGKGGPIARGHSVAELLGSCSMVAGIPSGANATSVRNAPELFGLGEVDRIPDSAILAGAVPHADGILGRPNMVDGHVGRFGWKADEAALGDFVSAAFRNELGLTNPGSPDDVTVAAGCGRSGSGTDVDQSVVSSVTLYVAQLPAPASHPGDAALFTSTGCAECHVPSLAGVPLYSDLLLHDMGRGLDDGMVQAQAQGKDWRTSPLWGLGQRTRFLHDGRATSLEMAVLAHGGEAQAASDRFRALSAEDRAALVNFLSTL